MNDRIDWPKMIRDLEKMGMNLSQQAKALNVGKSTVNSWKNNNTEPYHFLGNRLIQLWRSKNTVDLPTQKSIPAQRRTKA